MPYARAVVLITFAASLHGCGDNDNSVPRDRCDRVQHEAAFDVCRQATSESACVAAGGRWGSGGITTFSRCFCPTGQDGCPCDRLSQCLGACVAPSHPLDQCSTVTMGVCQSVVPDFGCVCTLRPEDDFSGLCAD
jgi:hypothetical protein